MSAALEGRMTVAINKLKELLKEDLEAFDTKPDNSKDIEINLIEFETLLQDLDDLILGICSGKDAINSAYEDWTELARKATSAERPEIDTMFKLFEKTHNPSRMVTEAEKVLIDLRKAKSKIARQIRVFNLEISKAAANTSLPAAPPPTAVTAAASEPRHQALQIFKFTGTDPDLWSDWWELFSSIHLDGKLTSERKFLYLRSYLPKDSPAGILIDGFKPSEYNQAIDLLKENYERDDKRVRNLQQQLIGLPTANTLEDVRKLHLQIERICRQLSSLGKETDSEYYYNILETKLTRPLLREVLVAKKAAGNSWTTSTFRVELKRLLDAEIEISSILKSGKNENEAKKGQKPANEGKKQNMPTVSCPGIGNQPKNNESGKKQKKDPLPCIFCTEKHWANECTKFSTLNTRIERLKELERCSRCFRKGHEAAQCENPAKCFGCDEGHPLALCTKQKIPQQPKFKSQGSNENKGNKRWKNKKSPATGANAVVIDDTNGVAIAEICSEKVSSTGIISQNAELGFKYCLLKCRQVQIFNPEMPKTAGIGQAFVDSGSQIGMISESKANELKLMHFGANSFSLRGIGPPETARVYSSKMVKLGIQTLIGPIFMEFRIVPDNHLPRMIIVAPIECNTAKLDTNPLQIAYKVDKPDILIGAKYHNELAIEKLDCLKSGFWLSASILGKMIDGEGNLCNTEASINLPLISSPVMDEDVEFYDQVKQLCQQEALYLDDQQTADEFDKQVHENFKRTLKFNEEEQRYEIELPVNEQINKLPTNYGISIGRLKSNLRNMEANPKIKEKYKQTMADQLNEGIIEYAPRNPDGPVHYLPHHGVWRADKEKLRVVFDASSHLGSAICLNDALNAGPVLTNDLAGCLLRFRLHKIVITADLKAAFLQLIVALKHRDLTRFLWPANPDDPNSPIRAFRFVRLTFGLNCSPFLLAATLLEHLAKFPNNDVAEMIKQNLYVDNIMMWSEEWEETEKICKEASEIFQNGGFHLREFASNHTAAMNKIPIDDRLTGMWSGQKIKVLGMIWDNFSDCIYIKMPEPILDDGPLTKRKILANIATPYDVLGLISPTLLEAKIFLSSLWEEEGNKPEEKLPREKLWDKPISEENCLKWARITKNWKKGDVIKFPRRLFFFPRNDCNFELHVFSDASDHGLGICIYLRTLAYDRVRTQLIFARSKVIPKSPKKRTIPRLELQALFLATKITEKVKKELDIVLDKIQFWTDSENLVKWLCKKEKQKDAFVNRRLEAISKHNVRHVAGTENPADIASRGVQPDVLRASDLWQNGPAWLTEKLAESEWPITSIYDYLAEIERKGKDFIFYSFNAATVEEKHEAKLPVELFKGVTISTTYAQMKSGIRHRTVWHKTKGTAVIVLRYITKKLANCTIQNAFLDKIRAVSQKNLGPVHDKQITVEELEFAEKMIVRSVQKNFPADKELENSLGGFFEDTDGILRVKGRLENTNLSEFAKFPIYIPKQSCLALFLLEESHANTFHGGVNLMTANVRQKFWIPQIRQKANKIIRQCFKCRPFQTKPFVAPQAPPLPAIRVVKAPAWAQVGVDYCGPFNVYEGKALTKKYICLFNCLVTRAIHLELANDATAEAFLKCFRRFCANCRVPKLIISDNGKNFTAAAKALGEIWKKIVKHHNFKAHCATNMIDFVFVTERAPWRNGFTEILNKGVKNALRRTFGRLKLNAEEFATTLYEIAAMLNERPLTYLANDAGEEILTPARLTKMELESSAVWPNFGVPDKNDPEYLPKKTLRDELIQAHEKSLHKWEHFWRIWNELYLTGLRERQLKAAKNGCDFSPREGSVVLIEDENMPRNCWRIGRIEKMVSERTAHLRVAGSEKIWKRAINQLYPLEIEGEELGIQRGCLGNPNKVLGFTLGLVPDKNNEFPSMQITNVFAVEEMDDECLELDYDEEWSEQPERTLKGYRIPKKKRRESDQAQRDDGRLRSIVVVPSRKNAIANQRRHYSPKYHRQRFSPKYRHHYSPSRKDDKYAIDRSGKLQSTKAENRQRDYPKKGERKGYFQPKFKEESQIQGSSSAIVNEQQIQLGKSLATILPPAGWNFIDECLPGRGEHKDCQLIQLDAIMGNNAMVFCKLRPKSTLHFQTLLQLIVADWTLRSFHASEMEEKAKVDWARELLMKVHQSPKTALLAWEEIAAKLKPTSKEKNDWPIDDFLRVLEARKNHCQVAQTTLANFPEKAIRSLPEIEWPQAKTEEGKSAAKLLARRLSQCLTEFRAKMFYGPAVKVIKTPTILIGDNAAVELGKRTMRVFASGPHDPHQLGNLLPHQIFPAEEVSGIVIFMGLNFIRDQNGNPEVLKMALDNMLQKLKPFGKRIALVTPSFVQNKYVECQRLYFAMKEICKKHNANYIFPKTSTREACNKLASSDGELTANGFDHVFQEIKQNGFEIAKKEKMPSFQKVRGNVQERQQQQSRNRIFINSNLMIVSILGLLTFFGSLFVASAESSHASSIAVGHQWINSYASWCKFGDSHLYDLGQKVNCSKTAYSESIKPIAIDIYEKMEAPLVLWAFRCEIRIDFAKYYANWLGDIFPTYSTKWAKIEKEECSLMARTKTCPFGKMIYSNGSGWLTKNDLNLRQPGFFEKLNNTELTANVTNCYVHNTTILMDRNTGEISVPGGFKTEHCWFKNGSCNLETGILKWEEKLLPKFCNFAMIKQNWHGGFDPDQAIWMNTNKDFILSWKNPKEILDCERINLTISDQGIAIPSKNYSKMLEISSRTRRNSLLTTDEEAGADTAISFAAIRAINKTINAIQEEQCQQKAKELAEIPLIFANNPEAAAKKLLNRTVQARWASKGLLEVWECVAIPLKNIIFRPTPNPGTCFKYLPVNATILGNPFEGFLDTVAMVLSSTSPIANCNKYGVQYIRIKSTLPGRTWQFLVVDQQTGKMPKITPNFQIVNWNSKNNYFPALHATIFHPTLHSPISNFIAEHGEEHKRLVENQKADVKMQSASFGFLELGLGEMKRKFDETMALIATVWQSVINVFVSLQILCLIIALIVTKIKNDQWLWQRGGNRKVKFVRPKKEVIEEESSSDESVTPVRRSKRERKRLSCGQCRGTEDPAGSSSNRTG